MSDYIYNEANKLLKKVKSRDLFEICDFLNINIYYNNELNDILGFYTIVNGRKAIVINTKSDELIQRQVLAHEIGHAILHEDYVNDNRMFKEFELMDMRSRPEYEANAFASHLLISDKEIDELSLEYDDYEKIAAVLGVNINMVMIKILELNKIGKNFNEMFIPKGNFLK